MSSIGHETGGRGTAIENLPEFELSFIFDDDDEPKRVTIFQPGTEEVAACRWISIDSDHAIPIEKIR